MRRRVLHNFKLKAAAVVIAVILWHLVGGQREAEVGFLVPLDLTGLPPELVMVTAPPKTVEIRLTGPQNYLKNVSLGQVGVNIDLSASREGVNRYDIDPSEVRVPTGIDVTSVTPRSFELEMEGLVSSLVPVRINLAGSPAEGYVGFVASSRPAHVTVVGRRNAVEKIKKVHTHAIDVEGLGIAENLVVPLELPAEAGSVKPDWVEVSIRPTR